MQLHGSFNAVKAGFEPAVPVSEYAGLANRWFQPLTHFTNGRANICNVPEKNQGNP